MTEIGMGINSYTVPVAVYCMPRDYGQKVAISAQNACEAEPKAECMTKEYMDLFAKITRTNLVDVNRPAEVASHNPQNTNEVASPFPFRWPFR